MNKQSLISGVFEPKPLIYLSDYRVLYAAIFLYLEEKLIPTATLGGLAAWINAYMNSGLKAKEGLKNPRFPGVYVPELRLIFES